MFEGIAGQARVKQLFARALHEGALSHAYLFMGREGLGKTAFARELGTALVTRCGGCGDCPECDRARRGLHPDLHILEREGDVIRVEQIEMILDDLALKPFGAGRRVWVIPEVERLRAETANRLLKAIEEPPRLVHFLLVTDDAERVLPTIVSRCQLVEFLPLGDDDIAASLRAACDDVGEAERMALARLAGGSIERAQRMAADACGPRRRDEYLSHASKLAERGLAATEAAAGFLSVLNRHEDEIKDDVQRELRLRLDELEGQFQDPRDLQWYQERAQKRAKREETRLVRLAAQDALDVLASWLRDLWVVACGAPDVLCNHDREPELLGAAVAAPEHYARLLAAASQTRKDLTLNIDEKLALKALFARFEEVAGSA